MSEILGTETLTGENATHDAVVQSMKEHTLLIHIMAHGVDVGMAWLFFFFFSKHLWCYETLQGVLRTIDRIEYYCIMRWINFQSFHVFVYVQVNSSQTAETTVDAFSVLERSDEEEWTGIQLASPKTCCKSVSPMHNSASGDAADVKDQPRKAVEEDGILTAFHLNEDFTMDTGNGACLSAPLTVICACSSGE